MTMPGRPQPRTLQATDAAGDGPAAGSGPSGLAVGDMMLAPVRRGSASSRCAERQGQPSPVALGDVDMHMRRDATAMPHTVTRVACPSRRSSGNVTGQIDSHWLSPPGPGGRLTAMAQSKSKVPASVPRRELAQILKDLRAASGLTLKQVAEQVGVDHGHLSRVERATRGISEELLGKLLNCPYAQLVSGDERDRAFELLHADLAEEDPYKRHSNLLTPTQYGGYLKFEAGASSLSAYEIALVPGLLQTKEYAAAVIEAMRPDLNSHGAATLVEIRRQRQERLLGAGKPFKVVIDEAALRRPVIAGEAMKRQLQRLIEVVEYPFVSVSFLPMTTGCHAGLYGSFMIMDFPEPTPSVVWVEGLAESTYFAKQDHVDRYMKAFDSLWERAVPLTADSDLVENVIKELPT